jgi:ipoprotein LpqH
MPRIVTSGKGVQVKRAMTVAVAGAAILAAGLSACSDNKTSTGGATKLTIDGKDQSLNGNAACVKSSGLIQIGFGSASAGVSAVLNDVNPPTVKSVQLGSASGVALTYQAGSGKGDASVTKDGNTYKITGNATGIDASNPMTTVTKPFELDATCG